MDCESEQPKRSIEENTPSMTEEAQQRDDPAEIERTLEESRLEEEKRLEDPEYLREFLSIYFQV